MTNKKNATRSSITNVAMEVIESISKDYFNLLMDSYNSIESSLDLKGKILLEFTPFLYENGFSIDEMDFLNDGKAIIYMSSIYNGLVRLECKVNALHTDNFLTLYDSELIAVKRIRRR